jgi:uncharacterized protein YuzE
MDSIRYSREANALYVRLDSGKKRIAETIPMGDDRFFDVDEKGNVLGIELLLPENAPEIQEAIIRTDSIELTS